MASTFTQIAPVLYGCGTVNQLGDKMKEMGASKALLVYDQGIKEVGTGPRVASIIRDAGLEVVEVDDVITEPPDTQIDAIYAAHCDEGIDVIVGLGGGSCLDAAKAIALLFAIKEPTIAPYLMPQPPKAVFPLIEIPTTSGTGSETSLVGVIGDTVHNMKGGVLHPMALSIVDPELAVTMDPFLTAITGMDAFSHSIEAMTSTMVNPKSDALASGAIRSVMKWLPVAVADPTNIQARDAMAGAATLGGLAFSDSFVNFGHATAETIGAKLHAGDGSHLPHGLCCGLVSPAYLEYAGQYCGQLIEGVADAMGVGYADIAGDYPAIGMRCADTLRQMMRQIGIPSFAEKGVTRDELLSIAEDAAGNFHNNEAVVTITPEIAATYLGRAFDGYQ